MLRVERNRSVEQCFRIIWCRWNDCTDLSERFKTLVKIARFNPLPVGVADKDLQIEFTPSAP
jgi:hypothetical protein